MDADWLDADGVVQRRVSVAGGQVVADEGEARVFDVDGETDESLDIDLDNRLPKSICTALLKAAGPGEIQVYDGRRYVLSSDREVWKRARIVRPGPKNSRWVAVDQTGKINTLRDPLARPLNTADPDELAAEVVHTWFRFRPDADSDDKLPPMHTYSWPKDREYRSLASAMKRIHDDQAGFFSLVGDSDTDSVVDRLAERYELRVEDALALLNEPLNTLLKPPLDKR